MSEPEEELTIPKAARSIRRRLVITAGVVVLFLGLVAVVGAWWLLRSRSGLALIRGQAVSLLAGKVNGRVHIGTISRDSVGHARVDTVEIRDMDDSILVATGPVSFDFDLLDLWDKRIALRDVVIERPYIHFRHDKAGVWNYKKVFASKRVGPKLPDMGGRKLGDVIQLDNVTLRNGQFKWTEPWAPSSYLRGTARDSAVRYALGRKDAEIKRVGRDLWRVRYWRDLQIVATHVRIKDPSVPGVAVQFSLLSADEFDPPFKFRDAHGHVLYARDTVRLSIDGFKLPGSAGSASGMLFTKRGLGARVRVIADTVSMDDIAWIYPTLPKEGGGKMTLDIRKDSTNDHIDYTLTKMDVISTKSRLRGAMTFGTGQPILELTGVDLQLDPVDFKLIETFNGGPLALPWAGQLRGHVLASGGPLNRFFVDSAAIEFTDGNVPGVVNRLRGRGELDIVRPILTSFHDFALDAQHFELRTAQAVDSEFPPWKGFVRGTARLDSIWTDVRFRDADVYYVADSTPSHFTGFGRVTVGEREMSYDVTLNADPMHLGTLALSYPKFPLRGAYRGPFTLKGSLSSLAVTGDVIGDGGRARTSNLWMNALGPVFGVRGQLDLIHVDPSRLLDSMSQYKGDITGTIDAALTGDSLSKLDGGVKLTLAPRSLLAGVRMQGGYSRLTFGEGLMRVDSLILSTDAMNLRGSGALGLRADRRDSLRILASIDSTGGLRALMTPANDTLPPIAMTGSVTGTLTLLGSLDSLDAQIGLRGTELVYGTTTARRATLDAAIADLTGARRGTVTLSGQTVALGGVPFTTLESGATLSGYDTARVTARLVGPKGAVIEGGANVSWDSLATRARLDSLQIAMGDHQWHLTRPSMIVSTRSGVSFDSLEVRSGSLARLMLDAKLPLTGLMQGTLQADSFPLADFGKLFPVTIPVSGAAALAVSLGGTRDAPLIGFEMQAQDAMVGETRVEGLHASGEYRERMMRAALEYRRKGAVVMRANANLPLDLSLKPVPTRLIDAPLSGTIVADSTDLAILESFSSAIRRASGVLDVHLTLGGSWERPRVEGLFRIANGSMELPKLGGIRYDDIRAQLRFLGDSLQIDTLSLRSDGDPAATARVYGSVGVKDIHDPSFNLRFVANRFHAIATKDLADLTLTTDPVNGLRLIGKKSGSALSGGVTTNGNIYVPETYSKSIIVLDERDYAGDVDTAAFGARRLVPSMFSSFIENMRIQNVSVNAGNALWLQSEEARIQLSGGLDMDVVSSTRPSDRGQRLLALTGTLVAEKGTYRLNLGPVVRTFTVENGGRVTFLGDPDNIPTLAINALYTVRQYDQRDARQDVRVRVTVGGTLAAPTVRLSSPDSVRTSTADLYSYLVTGAPSLEIGGRNSEYVNAFTSTLITSAGSVVGSKLGGWLNLDDVSVTTSGLGGYSGGAGKVTGNVLRGTRLGGGKQLFSNTFVRLDAGLCQFGQLFDNTNFDIGGFASTLGVKVDWRLNNNLSVSAGREPSTTALLCAQGATWRGFVPTPGQWSLDFVRLWRF